MENLKKMILAGFGACMSLQAFLWGYDNGIASAGIGLVFYWFFVFAALYFSLQPNARSDEGAAPTTT